MTAPGAAGPRRIVVMRHGETADNAARVWQGHRDTELSDRGRAQAREAAPLVASYAPDVIVSSDLRRAADTAQAVADLVRLEVRRDPRLREVDVGRWQGLHADEVRERYPDVVAALDRGEDVPKGVTGETRAQVAERAGAALRDVADALGPGRTALVVAHGVSGRAAATELVGLDHDVADQVLRSLDNCHWIVLVEAPKSFSTTAGWRIAAWNVGPRQP
ncbi:histidine phosphatase family protein [Terracoccus luteus]|uniref:Putative phosphoglycerate mutase n=1 Tax=Terracoccus luteus TaxID=53356 RepID=A0A839PU48_9MICO|nr:histidine phosphatase family protein [Terracoccus luteus]MBB2987037.1 putative phosphoglycerate mutase [Terracoccus luteus]MCP2172688.1 putative phosphoglycerate mutase [Terracoccus luteus]